MLKEKEKIIISGRVDHGLWHDAKIYCIDKGIKLSSFLENAIKNHLVFLKRKDK